MKLIAFLLLCPAALAPITGHWNPVYSVELIDGKQVMHEGLYISLRGMNGTPTVTIEGEADGNALPRVSGYLSKEGFIAAPIRNLDTYRLRKLTFEADRTWVLANPKQEFQLNDMEVLTVTGARTERQ